MEIHLFMLLEREHIFLARMIWVRQRGAVMAFIPDLFKTYIDAGYQGIPLLRAELKLNHMM